jgi:hypothetical protein
MEPLVRNDRPLSALARGLLSIVAIVAPLLALLLYTPSAHGLWIDTAYNFMHVPVFCAVAIGTFMLVGSRFRVPARVALTSAVVFILGVISEAAQFPTARDASFGDLGRDMVGGAVGIILCLVFSGDSDQGRSTKMILLLVAGLLLTPTLTPLSGVTLAYVERKQQLPILISGDQNHVLKFIRRQDATNVDIVPGASGHSCVLSIARNGRGPGLAFENLWTDWSAYEGIGIELDNPGSEPLDIVVRSHDLMHLEGIQPHSDRYNAPFTLDAGSNTLKIPMRDIRNAPAGRMMNIQRMNGLGIFSNTADSDAKFCVYRIELDGPSS